MKLVLLSPSKTLFDGEVDLVTIPGSQGLFTVLPHHAPLITTIDQGTVTYKIGEVEKQIEVVDGFAEIKNNIVSICVEMVVSE